MTRSPGPWTEPTLSTSERDLVDAVSATATASSDDRSISVTVDPTGSLTGLQLSRRAYERSPETLAQEILALSARARTEAQAAMEQQLADTGRRVPRPMSEQRFQDALRQLDTFDFGGSR